MVHFTQSRPAALFDSCARYVPRGTWVTPFGRPGISACLPLPRAFRGLPRPSSPQCPKASAYGPLSAWPYCCPGFLPLCGSSRSQADRSALAAEAVRCLHRVQLLRNRTQYLSFPSLVISNSRFSLLDRRERRKKEKHEPGTDYSSCTRSTSLANRVFAPTATSADIISSCLTKGGDPAAPSGTTTLLRLHPPHQAHLRRRPPCG